MAKFIKYLAKTTPSLTGQMVLARDLGFAEDLAENKFLHTQVWELIYQNKPKAGLAEKLVNRVLSPEQIDLVLAKEKRIGVLAALVNRNKLSEEQGLAFIEKKAAYSTIAKKWWGSGNVPEILKGRVALDAKCMVEYALGNSNLSDEAVLQILENHPIGNAHALEELLNVRANLVETLVTSSKYSIKLASLSSRHLFNQELMKNAVTVFEKYEVTKQFQVAKAVLENPNASKSTLLFIEKWLQENKNIHAALYSNLLRMRFLQCSDSVEIPWEDETNLGKIKLINRYAGVSPVRLKIVRSLSNLSLSQIKVNQVESSIKEKPESKKINYGNIKIESFTIPTEGVFPTVKWLSSELDIYGESAWEAAIMLLQTEYQGSMQNLVDTAKSI